MNGIRLVSFLAIICLAFSASGQQAGQAPAKKGQRIRVIHSLELRLVQELENAIQVLRGKVELRQDSVFMYCDSARIENETLLSAFRNVLIQQGDSLQIFADQLIYDGTTRLAILEGNVVLVNAGQQLFTESLEYDLNTRIARYFTGATLISDSLQLSSRRGFYLAESQEVFFRDSVRVVDPKFSLKADSLKYFIPSRTVGLLGPTLLATDSSKVYCESGYYETLTEKALFTVNAQYQKGSQTATADSISFDSRNRTYELAGNARVVDSSRQAEAEFIRYDEAGDQIYLRGNAHFRDGAQDIRGAEIRYDSKNKSYSTRGRSAISDPPQLLEADSVDFSESDALGRARGNVIWRDTSDQYTILCNEADYDRTRDYIKASGGLPGRPELISMLDGDSLFLSADTLLVTRQDSSTTDTARIMQAIGQVRLFKSNFQAICDSLAYNGQDSTFALFGSPVIWSDTSQFTADTIVLYLQEGKIQQIKLRNNGFILIAEQGGFFNQIKGRDILAHFSDSKLQRMDASGNAEVIYYAKDADGAYLGVNQTACSEMVIRMADNQIQRITFLAQPTAKLLPMGQTDHEALKLKGFKRIQEGRPLRREEIYVQSR
ncbi:MAG: OstA-like protein [Saprospiraceae bacterium]